MPRTRSVLTVGRIKALRWVFLGIAALLAGGLGWLYWAGRQGRVDVKEPPKVRTSGSGTVGSGFDQTITHEGKPLLRIRGTRDRRDEKGNLHVEEVLITAFQADGSRFEVAADTATYNLESKEAVLAGHVSLAGPDGFALGSDKLVLKEGGRVLESDSPVTLRYGTENPINGRAQVMRALVNRGQFFLSGGVSLRTRREGDPEAFTMGSERLLFFRSLHQLRAEGKVEIKWGRSHLKADRIAGQLSPDDQRLQFVRARWGVRGVLMDTDSTGAQRHLIAEGDSLAVLIEEAGSSPSRLELEGDGEQPAHIQRGVSTVGDHFDLRAAQVNVGLVGGNLDRAEATGDAVLVQRVGNGPPRNMRAGKAVAQFAVDGQLSELNVEGGVKVVEQGRTLDATRAVVTPAKTEAWGEPAVLVSERGELRAPRLDYAADSKLAHATGGVEATMAKGKANPLQKTPLADADEPVRVESDEAFWSESPQTFLFKGKVRAWSGDRVLRAEQMRGDVDQQQLSAAGKVETVWFMPPAKEGEQRRQVRATAASMTYSDRSHEMLYEGDVKVVDGARTLAADTVHVELTEKGEAKKMAAAGKVKLDAPAEGRSITAERADYELASGVVVFLGNPVTLVDKKGGTLSGRQAVYSTKSSKVKVTAEEDPAAIAAAMAAATSSAGAKPAGGGG